MPIPVFRPFIKRKDMDAVLTCLVSDNPGPGDEADAFVEDVLVLSSQEVGIALREYPRGIQLALQALDLAPGARVAVPVLAPRMWEQAIKNAGFDPVYIDVEENVPCISPDGVSRRHQEAPLAAVIAIDSYGSYCDREALLKFGIPLIEDITQVFAPPHPDHPIPGKGARICLLGLEANGLFTAGGGVLIMTSEKKDAAILARLSDDLPTEVYLPDMNAALARAQMKELARFIERRVELQELFSRAIMRGKHRVLGRGTALVPFSFPVVIQSSVQEVQAYARKKHVESIRAFSGSILHFHETSESFDARSFPHASVLLLRTVLFPLYPGLSRKEIEVLEKVLASLP